MLLIPKPYKIRPFICILVDREGSKQKTEISDPKAFVSYDDETSCSLSFEGMIHKGFI